MLSKWRCSWIPAALMLGIVAVDASAEATALRVLVRADDAKFIGSDVGGIAVSIRDSETGVLLGQGEIAGGTGDTEGLMLQPQSRGGTVVDKESASVELTVDIARPTRVEVSARGPLAYPQSEQRVAQTLWLIPGKDRRATPVILELAGLILDMLDLQQDGREIKLTVFAAMLCGCPITADGLWPASDFALTAQLQAQGQPLLERSLSFTGEPSQFAVALNAPVAGPVELVVEALQHSTGNAGVYRLSLDIPR